MLLVSISITTSAFANQANWNPKSSERLIKLPINVLEKQLEHDFNKSDLGQAMKATNQEIKGSNAQIKELTESARNADGELLTELQHQTLVAKKQYIENVGEKINIKRKRVNTMLRVYEGMLQKINSDNNFKDEATLELVELQNQATQRFESVITKVDDVIFSDFTAKQSKYSKKYAKNQQAIEQLIAKLDRHDMNVNQGDNPQNKIEYLQQAIIEVQGELAILEQEETILGYMAKIVALDAMALAETSLDKALADGAQVQKDYAIADDINLFLN